VPRNARLTPSGGRRDDRRLRGRAARTLVALAAVMLAAAGLAAPAGAADAADAPTMEAAAMLEGHGRVGAWMGIQVRLRNDGPAVTGELRLTGGAQSRTRFGTPVDLPTQSDKVYTLYAQPPAFGGQLDVALVSGGRTLATRSVAFTVHDTAQLVVGVIAEQPQGIIPHLDLLPSPNGARPAIVPLAVEDLPERVQGWATLDRLVWQDIDSSQLSSPQIEAMRGWLASGGQLVVAGGTTGGAVLTGFPDDLLPYRPTGTTDVAPDALAGLLGEIPADATDVPALSGELARGRALASVGELAVAAEMPYGGGRVTLLGFDPGSGWVGDLDSIESLWRRFLPPRSGGPVIGGDDNQLVNAVSQLPALALPPIGGLLLLLGGYILLIGPVNYLVLRRLDRREWAWITMPVLIAVFAAGAYGFGAALRGLDVIVNEVAIVRGAPNATEGSAQVYLGVFSPSRGTYQVEVGGGALVSSTLAGDFVGGNAGALDVLQGDVSRIRDLVIGFGSLRTVRAETAATVPLLEADLRLENGVLTGQIHNRSTQPLEKPAVVLGGSVVVLEDLAAGTSQEVRLPIRTGVFGQSLSDRILGTVFFGDPNRTSESTQRNIVRHAVLDQLTYDPNMGGSFGQLPSDSPVLLAWGTSEVLDVRISGQEPRRTGNVLYYIPLAMTVEGPTVFEADLIRSSLVETDPGMFFNKDPFSINMTRGSATVAYRPIPFEGTFTPSRVVVSVNFGDVGFGTRDEVLRPADPQPCRDDETDAPDCVETEPPDCDPNTEDCFARFAIPELELFDRSDGGRWVRMNKPEPGNAYELEDPERYVDPGSGTLLVKFVNEFGDSAGFNFQLRIEGEVR
jgi:hypothetical protein